MEACLVFGMLSLLPGVHRNVELSEIYEEPGNIWFTRHDSLDVYGRTVFFGTLVTQTTGADGQISDADVRTPRSL